MLLPTQNRGFGAGAFSVAAICYTYTDIKHKAHAGGSCIVIAESWHRLAEQFGQKGNVLDERVGAGGAQLRVRGKRAEDSDAAEAGALSH